MWREIVQYDATAQAELVRRREVQPIDLVEAAIGRIERFDGAVNAVTDRFFEAARQTARRPLPDGPFRGVPMLLKDLVASLGGQPQRSGSRFLRNAVAPADTTLVRRLKQAGFVIIGKTNTPEFGLAPTTEPALHGPTRNPWDPRRSSGGSSGGSAAAVAMRHVAIAHGNDGGGSIRTPAACCGVFGFKPTRGRNPTGPDIGELPGGLVVEHALTWSVRDSAALLDATAGPEPGDPYAAPAAKRAFRAEAGARARRLNIAVSTNSPTGVAVHPSCRRAALETAELCAELGHHVEELAPEFDAPAMLDAFVTVWTSACAAAIDAAAQAMGRLPGDGELEPATRALWQRGRQHSAGAYLAALARLQALGRTLAQFFERWDAWLTPTLTQPPPPLGWFDATDADPLIGLERAIALVPFPPIANATGQPAMSVPTYWDESGLPIGVQFIGRFGDEATLFRLAAQLEAATAWHERLPALARDAGTADERICA